jgi:hypothetical protein
MQQTDLEWMDYNSAVDFSKSFICLFVCLLFSSVLLFLSHILQIGVHLLAKCCYGVLKFKVLFFLQDDLWYGFWNCNSWHCPESVYTKYEFTWPLWLSWPISKSSTITETWQQLSWAGWTMPFTQHRPGMCSSKTALYTHNSVSLNLKFKASNCLM